MESRDKPISIVLVAVGGYGQCYVNELLAHPERPCRIEGVVDPFAERSGAWPALKEKGVPRYDTLDDFYREHRAELAVISTPIHLHRPHTCAALENGSNVLCEKPVAGAIQDAAAMRETRDRSGRFVAIGYNWSFSSEIQALKRDLMAGAFGRPLRFKSMALGPRYWGYYSRCSWAGKMRMPAGEWVLDSPANNACAHYLHNMLYLLGETVDRSAKPVEIDAELYRVQATENFDTAAMRVRTKGAEVMFFTSHAVMDGLPIQFVLECEKGTVMFGLTPDIEARFSVGGSKVYPVRAEEWMNKLWFSIEGVRTGQKPLCGVEAASAQTLCINGAQDSSPVVHFPRLRTKTRDVPDFSPPDKQTYVEGLTEELERCYLEWKLPSEAGLPWASPGKTVDLRNYGSFPGGT